MQEHTAVANSGPAAPVAGHRARYAIYFTPQPNTALSAFGRSWFGRAGDASTRHAFSEPGMVGFGSAKLPVTPGRYNGLHVPFKAPFTLRRGMGPEALRTRLQRFAARRQAIGTGPMTLARDGQYLLLRPVQATPALDWLAAQCVAAFEGFADAIGEDDRTEHLSPHLSDYQRLLLESFGDPHVLSEFRFCLNLAGPLEPSPIDQIAEALWPVLEGICEDGITIDALSLLCDAGGRAPLRLTGRYPLGG